MSKYPQEIIKQAEELIEQHDGSPIKRKDEIKGISTSVLNKVRRHQAIKAAIVSCKFAIKNVKSGTALTLFGNILAYLEELL